MTANEGLSRPATWQADDQVTRERVFADFDALHDHLLHLNAEGIPPDVSGYDKNGSPIVVWLDEEGGDCTVPLALTLGGDDAAHPEPDRHHAEDLAYPVLILDVSVPAVSHLSPRTDAEDGEVVDVLHPAAPDSRFKHHWPCSLFYTGNWSEGAAGGTARDRCSSPDSCRRETERQRLGAERAAAPVSPAPVGDVDAADSIRRAIVEAGERHYEAALEDHGRPIAHLIRTAWQAAAVVAATHDESPRPAPVATERALADLVKLKDGPRDDTYRATKEQAWQVARDVLAGRPAPVADREELAALIAENVGGGNPNVRAITRVADALIAAGYGKGGHA